MDPKPPPCSTLGVDSPLTPALSPLRGEGVKVSTYRDLAACRAFVSFRPAPLEHSERSERGREYRPFQNRLFALPLPLYVSFHLPCLAGAKREDGPPPGLQAQRRRRGRDRFPLGPWSPSLSQIRPRFCVPNSNRCLSDALNAPARIRKNESEHNRTYE